MEKKTANRKVEKDASGVRERAAEECTVLCGWLLFRPKNSRIATMPAKGKEEKK